MTEHKWKKDRYGADSCEREWCTVRRFAQNGVWQRKKRAPWRRETDEPIPPCTGKDAEQEVTRNPPLCSNCGEQLKPNEPGPRCDLCKMPVAVSDPSPLEVVRRAIDTLHATSTALGANAHRDFAYAALATLEESIRKDEREKCADAADKESEEWFGSPYNETTACQNVARRIRNRK